VSDPKRLAELGSEAPNALRGLLRSGREDLPNAERLSGLAARLGPLLGGAAVGGIGETPGPDAVPGPEAVPPDPSAAASTASGSTVAAKAIGVGAAVVVLVGGAWLLTRPDPVTKTAPSFAAPVVQQSPASRIEPSVAPEPPAPAAESAHAAPESARPAKAPASEAARGQASGPSESALLAQAQAALRTDPARALALTREHKRRFPKGALSQEREVIAIEALNRIGDSESARKRAKDFENSYPGSAHRRKVQDETKP
jgi:hypothetical protein